MTFAKALAMYIAAQLRKELTIQSAPPVQRKSASEKIQQNKILKNGLNGFAMIGLICLIVGFFTL